MHCDVAYKPQKIAIEMRVRFRLKPEAYPLGLVKQVVEEDAHWKSNRLAVYFGSQNSKLGRHPCVSLDAADSRARSIHGWHARKGLRASRSPLSAA
jgi:hypothetical protein